MQQTWIRVYSLFSFFVIKLKKTGGDESRMRAENILAKNISSTGDKASYDAACKRLLANKVILAWIMKSCLEEYRECGIQEIVEQYIEGNPDIAQVAVNIDEFVLEEQIKSSSTEDNSIYEGTVTYDIRFYAMAPRSKEKISLIINVEAQNDFYPGYPIIKRGIYYCSRLISSQYGVEFSDAHYEKIKKVYSIWICMNPPEYRKNSINRYSIKEEHLIGDCSEKVKNYDLLAAIMICLGDSDDEKSFGVLKLLEVLLSSERGEADEKKKILQDDFEIEMTNTLEREVSIMCNLSKGVEEKGIEKGIIFSIRNLMDTTGWSAKEAMKVLKIPESDQYKYWEELEKEKP